LGILLLGWQLIPRGLVKTSIILR